MLLVDVCQFDCLADGNITIVRLFKSHDKTEKRSLAGTVRTDYTDNAGRRKNERKMLEQKLVAISLRNIIELDDLVSELRTIRNIDFEISLFLLAILAGQSFISTESGLGLGVTHLRSHPDPLKLALQCLSALALLFFLHFQTLGLLLKP